MTGKKDRKDEKTNISPRPELEDFYNKVQKRPNSDPNNRQNSLR